MKHTLVIGTAALALSAAPVLAKAQSTAPPPTVQAKQEFIKSAAQDDMADLALGNLVKHKATDAAVKQLAERIVQDHSKDLAQVKQLAAQDHVVLPPSPTEEQDALTQHLQRLTGNQLEQEYLKAILQGHEETIAAFEIAAHQSQDTDLQRYAQKTLPILQQHLKMAQDAQNAAVGISGRK
jgi:putative membrane protein